MQGEVTKNIGVYAGEGGTKHVGFYAGRGYEKRRVL